jgi:tetratricopeptide (TPR) repeat protein
MIRLTFGVQLLKPETNISVATKFAAGSLASLIFVGSGCAAVGTYDGSQPAAPVPTPAEATAIQDSRDGRVELRNWSQLTKSGREHQLYDDLGAAEQDLLAAFDIAKSFRNSDARRRASIGNLRKLATDYRVTGNQTAAARILQAVADATIGSNEFDVPGLSALMLDLGDLQQMDGKINHAANAYERALELQTGKSGQDSATLIPIYHKLSAIEIKRERFDRALAYATRALAISENHSSADSAKMITSELQVASANRYAGNLGEAEAQFKHAIEAQREIEASTLTEAVALNGLAYLHLEAGRLQEALLNVELSLAIFDEKEHRAIDRAMILDTKAQILAAEGRTDSAEKLFDKVMLSAKSASPEEQRILYESYERFLRDQNRSGEALEIRRKIEQIDADSISEASSAVEAESAESQSTMHEAQHELPDVSSAPRDIFWDAQ